MNVEELISELQRFHLSDPVLIEIDDGINPLISYSIDKIRHRNGFVLVRSQEKLTSYNENTNKK